jgi:hypothetical protein
MHTRIHSGHWWGKGEPIHVSALQDTRDGPPGIIDNIRFTDITANSETGILIYGIPQSVIENIYLNNIQLTINNGKYTESYGGNFDLRPAYPMDVAIFKHDIPGLYAQYVNHLTISHFELNWGKNIAQFFTRAVEIDHFENILLDDVRGSSAFPSGGPAIKISNGSKAILRNCSTKPETNLIYK